MTVARAELDVKILSEIMRLAKGFSLFISLRFLGS